MSEIEADETIAVRAEHSVPPIMTLAATEALKRGPVGALVVASIAVALLFIGWLAFYFLLFLPRGPIG
jgi:hypothetical protein